MTTPKKKTRVFISFSHDTPEHEERVLDLANHLRRHGVDAWIDLFEPHPAEGWQRWMQRQIERADFVVLVCTASYKRRFEGNEAPGIGRGVSWEGKLLSQLVYDAGGRNDRVIPIVLDDDDEDAIPLAFKPYTFYHLPDQYDALYRRLTGQPAVVAEPLGDLREMPVVSSGIPDEITSRRPSGHTGWRRGLVLWSGIAVAGLGLAGLLMLDGGPEPSATPAARDGGAKSPISRHEQRTASETRVDEMRQELGIIAHRFDKDRESQSVRLQTRNQASRLAAALGDILADELNYGHRIHRLQYIGFAYALAADAHSSQSEKVAYASKALEYLEEARRLYDMLMLSPKSPELQWRIEEHRRAEDEQRILYLMVMSLAIVAVTDAEQSDEVCARLCELKAIDHAWWESALEEPCVADFVTEYSPCEACSL